MKRVIFLLLTLMFIGATSGQQTKQKVAVYITDNSNLNAGEFAGDFLVNAIVKQGTYLAVERTADFLKELNREQVYQRDGSVDDSQISKLGKQFGVQLVCVVKVGKMGGGYFMSARLIDVETATLTSTARPQKFSNIDEIEKTCEAVTASIFGEKESSSSSSSSSSLSSSSSSSSNIQRHPAESEMVFVQGGTFWMGCTQEQQGSCEDIESPLHKVTVSDFYIGRYEVTQAQWKMLMGSDIRQQRDKAGVSLPLFGEGDNYPMYYVSWQEAQEFILRLSAATGKSYRLPTEAEWEYAARGGSKSKGYKFSGSNLLENVAWFTDNSGSKTYPVGTKQPNELGIYDMSGSVWEWCYDWSGAYPTAAQSNPIGASVGSSHVARGGSWNYGASYCRVAIRGGGSPDARGRNLGFRLVCSSK